MAAVSEDYIHEWRKKLLCLCTVGEDCLRFLLRFYLNPDPNVDIDKELADVFKNAIANKFDVIYKSKISSLNYPSNDTKIYKINATGNKVVKDTIIIDELDITFMGDILKNINSLMSLTGVQQPCKNGHIHLCCQNHNHKCAICKKLICNNTPKQCCNQNECDHNCSNCGNLHSMCKRQSTICCNACNLCLNCSSLVHCHNFTLQKLIDIIKKELRNCSMHLTNNECENPNFDFPEVNDCNTWNDVLMKFVDALKNIIIYLHSKLYITEDVKHELFLKVKKVETGEALYKYYERAIEKMIKSERKYDTLQDTVTEHTKDIHNLKDADAVHTKDIYNLNDTDAEQTKDIEDIKKDVEHVKRKQHKITENKRRDENGIATRNVLSIIAKEINKDWKTLSCKLGVNLSIRERLLNKSCEERLHQSFEKLQYKIQWKILKEYLIQMNRNDIIVLVERENTITLGDEKLKENSSQLKRFYKEKLMKWNQPKAFKGKGGREHVIRDRNDVFVQLMMGEWLNAHENDREHFLRGMNRQRQVIKMDELLDGDGKFIIVRGIAGIGKTSFVDSFLLNWADEKVYQDYYLVIKLTCRELNVLHDVKTLRDLLNSKYPDELGDFMCDSLDADNVKVLVILDGLDEFRYLKEIIGISQGKPSAHPLVSVIYDLINPVCHPNKKVIVCGRPQASEEIYNCFRGQGTYKLVEIAGFNEQNIDLFIDKHFVDDITKAELMKQKLSEQEHLKSMARIPIYAYILCNVFNNGALVEELDTTTKLNIASCLVFLRDHMRNYIGYNIALIYLCKDKVIVQVIRKLSKIAYKSLAEQRIIFDEEDFSESEYLSSIEDSGIIERHEGGENGDIYQFKHLVLQEFLGAIHILNESIDIEVLKEMPHFNNSILILIGLVGLLHNKSLASSYLQDFVKEVVDIQEENLDKYDTIVFSIFKSLGSAMVLDAVHEYNCDLPDHIQRSLLDKNYCFTINYHHHLQRLAYFLNNIKAECVQTIDIEIKDGNVSPNEMLQIAPYLVRSKLIDISNTTTNVDGYKYLAAKIIKPNVSKQLETLFFNACNLNDECIIALSPSIPYLKSFYLKYNVEITATAIDFNEILRCIREAEKRNENSFKELTLIDCDLDDEWIIALSPSRSYLESLDPVDLNYNRYITATGFNEISRCICEAQKRNENSLKELTLQSCDLDDECIIALSPSIPYLESLDLDENRNITAAGYNEISRCICEAQKRNENLLKKLTLHGCDLSDECVVALSKLIPNLEY